MIELNWGSVESKKKRNSDALSISLDSVIWNKGQKRNFRQTKMIQHEVCT